MRSIKEIIENKPLEDTYWEYVNMPRVDRRQARLLHIVMDTIGKPPANLEADKKMVAEYRSKARKRDAKNNRRDTSEFGLAASEAINVR